jgi:hypothetical protein|tara:strand:- start:127 stop:486 length:360 start_codon:yes stop_codon:yes gene_type:complete
MKEDFMNNITVEIKKRYDSCYNVWQWISLAELFKPTNSTDDTTEVQESIKPSYVSVFSDVLSFKDLAALAKGTTGIPKSAGKWVIVSVLKNKKEATEYCKSTWGRKCFKERKGLSVTYV